MSDERRRSRAGALEVLAVLCLVCAFVALSATAQERASATFDEPLHIFAAAQARAGDLRVNPEHPALVKRLVGLALPPAPPAPPAPGSPSDIHRASEGWAAAFALLYGPGANPTALLRPARLTTIALGAALLLAVYGTARAAFGRAGGLAALAACALEPNLLGHAAVVHYDAPSVAGIVAATGLTVAAARRDGRRWALAAGLALGLALSAKHSALLAAPVLLGWLAWTTRDPRRTGLALAAAAAAVVVVHGGPSIYADSVRALLADSHRPSKTLLLGQAQERAGWAFFPVTLATKLPLALLIAGLGGLTLARARPAVRLLGVVLLAQLLLLATQGFGLGLRYALLAVPLLALGVGALAARWPAAALVALCWLAADGAGQWPGYLDYFNRPSRPAGHAGQLVADSSLDWGQGLPALADWRRAHPGGRLYLAYFGNADPAAHGLRVRTLPGFGAFSRPQPDPRTAPPLAAPPVDDTAGQAPWLPGSTLGRWTVAISANQKLGLMTVGGMWDWLDHATALAPAAPSIWLYDVTDAPEARVGIATSLWWFGHFSQLARELADAPAAERARWLEALRRTGRYRTVTDEVHGPRDLAWTLLAAGHGGLAERELRRLADGAALVDARLSTAAVSPDERETLTALRERLR